MVETRKMARIKQTETWVKKHGRREPRKTVRKKPIINKKSAQNEDIPEEKGNVPDGSGSELEDDEFEVAPTNKFPEWIQGSGWCVVQLKDPKLLKWKRTNDSDEPILALSKNHLEAVEVTASQTIVDKKGTVQKTTWKSKLSCE